MASKSFPPILQKREKEIEKKEKEGISQHRSLINLLSFAHK